MSRCATDHSARLLADCVHLAGPIVDSHDRRLEHDHAASALIDDSVRRAQVDRQLTFRPRATQFLPTPTNHLPRTVSVIPISVVTRASAAPAAALCR